MSRLVFNDMRFSANIINKSKKGFQLEIEFDASLTRYTYIYLPWYKDIPINPFEVT